MSVVIITPSSPHTALTLSTNEFLTIAAGAWVSDADDGISQFGGDTDGEIDVDGSVTSENAIYLLYDTGDEIINVGSTGVVSGSGYGINFEVNHTGTQFVQNAGYIHGSAAGVQMNAAGAELENSGTIDGGYNGVVMESPNNAFVENDGAGVISGQTGIKFTGSSGNVLNAGTISGASSTGHAITSAGSSLRLANSGSIQGQTQVVNLGGGDDYVTNSGKIQAAGTEAINFTGADDSVQNSGIITAADDVAISFAGDGVSIDNSGKISSADDTIELAGSGSGTDFIVNETGGDIEAPGVAIFSMNDATHVVNHGDIYGAVYLRASGSVFANTGDFSGAASFLTGGVTIRNVGTISNDGGQNIHIGGASGQDDRLVNAVNAVIDDAGGTAIYHGSAGTFRIVNHGDIYGNITSGQTSFTNVGLMSGNVSFAAGASLLVNRVEIDGSVTFAGTGNIYRGLAGEVTGTIYGAGADGRYLGGGADDTFDMTASGAHYVSGGAGDDTFLFTAAGLTAQTRVLGGVGDDALTFTTAGTFSPSAFAHVSGVETINLASGNNTLTLTNALVSSADGGALTVNGANFIDTINASAVTTATDTVTIYGGLGADVMTAGGGEDVFVYRAANESTGPNYDTIAGANFGVDVFDVSAAAKSILAINTAVTSGSLSTSTFNADLAADLPAAKLGAHDAVLFTASAGTLAGQTFLIVDVNGTAGYQANADLVIHLTGATGSLTTGNFV